MVRPLPAVLVVAYALVVAHLTLTDPATGQWAFGLADRAAARLSHGRLQWSETEVLANVALFVPLGFLLTLALSRVWPAVALCALASAAVEQAQLHVVTSRVATTADVVHNCLGGLLGALVAGVGIAALGPGPGQGSTDGQVLQARHDRHRQGLGVGGAGLG